MKTNQHFQSALALAILILAAAGLAVDQAAIYNPDGLVFLQPKD